MMLKIKPFFNDKVKAYVKAGIEIGQNNYPEMLGASMIINAPWIFTAIWAVAKIWIDKNTCEKIKIME